MKNNLKRGYISILAVVTLSSIMLLMLTASFRYTLQNQETQKKTQIRVDYTNREQALLRAVLTEVPNSAMKNMMANSNTSSWSDQARWRWVFEYARNKADGEKALEKSHAEVLGINGHAISGNTGDGSQDHIKYSVSPVKNQPSNHWFYVNAGTNSTGNLLGSQYPETLQITNASVEKLDRDRPIITMDKTYSDGTQFKVLPYPQIHFGYVTQGQNFLAKRNWWAFSIALGSQSEDVTGVATVRKNYVLSIYEVPAQLALGSSASATTALGKHQNGAAWDNINISGGVFATKASAVGSLSLDRLTARRGITLAENSSVGGVSQDQFTGDLPSREAYEAENDSFFPLASSSDSGLVAFLPITHGEGIFDDLTDTSDPNSASPTGWNYYSRPAMQTVMKLRVVDVISPTDQTPTAISFTYLSNGISKTDTFTRGGSWPEANSREGAKFPFHLETSPLGRQALAVYTGRLAAHLEDIGADSLEANSSLMVNADYVNNINISKPNIPSLSTDISLILRDTKDFTPFPRGFSLVTPFRLYLANDVNIAARGEDDEGNPVYPPISLFAPEKRFGIRDEALNIDFKGQINHVGKKNSDSVFPMDLRSGMYEEVDTDKISADLHSITDLNQLPPINQMNWLVVIEQVD